MNAIADKGPWRACLWSGNRVVVCSDDFTHDVTLQIFGDFIDEDRMAYAEWLASVLNNAGAKL